MLTSRGKKNPKTMCHTSSQLYVQDVLHVYLYHSSIFLTIFVLFCFFLLFSHFGNKNKRFPEIPGVAGGKKNAN
jgi:hypothetical protein